MEARERELAVEHLAQSRERLLLAIEGLSDEQKDFRAAEDRWSIAQCIEHITLVETIVLKSIQKALQSAPETHRKSEVEGKDQVILEKVPARDQRLKGPEHVMPNDRPRDFEELLRQFEATRERSVRFSAVTRADLRSYFFPHPFLGTLDCYQWLLFLSGHCERHVRQIEEIQADPLYPRPQAQQAQA